MTDEPEAQTSTSEEGNSRVAAGNDDGNHYQVYKERWLVLAAVFSISFINGLQKSFLPIADILNKQLAIGFDTFRSLNQIPLFTSILTVVPLSRALHRCGIRKMVSYTEVSHRDLLPTGLRLTSDNSTGPFVLHSHYYSALNQSSLLSR